MSRLFARSLVLSVLLLLPHAAVGADQTRQADTAAEKTADKAFVPPQIILGTQKQPIYPPAAFDARYSGSVLVEMTVLKDGMVGNVKVIECTRPKVGFEESAIKAVRSSSSISAGSRSTSPSSCQTRTNVALRSWTPT